MPVTRIEALDLTALRGALARLSAFDWIVFTSQNAVRVFWEAARSVGVDVQAVRRLKIAGVGPATATALREIGLEPTVQPARFVAEGVLDAMTARDDVRGARVLYASAQGARDVIPRGLESVGAIVERVDIYRSVPSTEGGVAMRSRIEHGDIDLVTYTAGSAVRAFVDAVGADAARRVAAASIGPVTSDVARELGLSVVAEAKVSTMPALVDAIARHFASSRVTEQGR